MNNDIEKIESLEETSSKQFIDNKQNESINLNNQEKPTTKKSIPVPVVIVSMILLALIIGGFIIVGEMVAKEKGYGSDSNIVNNVSDNNEDLDRSIFINGYKFELGVKLDAFLDGTNAVIDDGMLEKAKTGKSLYEEIEASITKDDDIVKFKIYVDATDEENVTIQGISIVSDRAFVEANQELSREPNLVTVEFNVLGKYDVDKTLFSNLDEELQKLAKKTKIEDRDAYELILKDSTGYEIKITFINNDNDEDKYYIYNVVMMNVKEVS